MPTINSSEWFAALDAAILASGINTPIIEDRGFTIHDIMVMRGLSRSKANSVIMELKHNGVIKQIGWRSGRNAAKVYEMVELDKIDRG